MSDILHRVDFDDAWREAEGIEGLVRRKDMCELHRRACAVPYDQIIVEIGCYCGRSTVVLAASGRDVWAVDPMEIGSADGISVQCVVTLQQNIIRHANITWMRTTTLDVPDPYATVGLLFIDGCHHKPWPERDYKRFAPHMVANACVVFHDYPSDPGVVQTVSRLVESGGIAILEQVGTTVFCEHRKVMA